MWINEEREENILEEKESVQSQNGLYGTVKKNIHLYMDK